MSTIVTRAGKGSALTHNEVDANFTNLNTDKLEAATSATLTNKTIALGSNTVSGTIAQFNTAVTDADLATLAGSETLSNKTLASPTITGATTAQGVAIVPENAMGALVIDTARGWNTKSISADTTFTFSGAPTAETFFALELANSSGTARTITIPSSYSIAKQANITTFVIPANGYLEVFWHYDGASYRISGDPLTAAEQRANISAADTAQTFALTYYIETPSDKTYTLWLNLPFACTLTNHAAKTSAGTLTALVAIDGVTATGSSLSVTSTESSSAITAANSVASGNDVAITVSSNSSGANLSGRVTFTRTLA